MLLSDRDQPEAAPPQRAVTVEPGAVLVQVRDFGAQQAATWGGEIEGTTPFFLDLVDQFGALTLGNGSLQTRLEHAAEAATA